MPSASELVKAVIRACADISPHDEMAMLMDLRERVWQLEEENGSLRRENRELRERLAARKRLERRGASVFVLEDDGTETGPICPCCYREDGLVMLLVRSEGGARCTRCKTEHAGVASALEGPDRQLGSF